MHNLKYYKLHLLTIFCLFITISCSDFLDKQPDDMITIDRVFADRLESERYLRNVYSFLPDEASPGASYAGASDEGDIIFSWAVANQLNNGNWSPLVVPFDNYSAMYQGIRSASVFIDRIDECKECEQYVPGVTTQWGSEARALRAWYYFLLMRKFGPVVLMEETLPVDGATALTQIPRSTFDECVDYIIAELDLAQPGLPAKTSNEQEYGRVDQRVVQAMKSRILLYAASPLWNGNAGFSNFKNIDGTTLVNTNYDATKWQKAAEASKALIDMMPTGLFRKNDTGGNFDPFLSYRDLFFERWNYEIIWARPSTDTWNWEKHTALRQLNGYNGITVTQNLVDAYHMNNGLRIDETGSGYVETGFSNADTKYTKSGDWNMYLNREPRFYATVLYNGDIWPYTANGTVRAEMYATGRSGKNGSHDYSTTGYLTIKFSSPNSDAINQRFVLQSYIYFRLGEIYLNYAEALNEYDPGNPDIALYVNLVRARGGIPALPGGLTQDEMRERIRHERRIELAFENHRVFDTRRWLIAENTDGGPMYGMNVSKGTGFSDTEFYQRTVFETRIFTQKHYLWPIPQYEIDRNTKMVQNPGW